jgi:hypothetical protein
VVQSHVVQSHVVQSHVVQSHVVQSHVVQSHVVLLAHGCRAEPSATGSAYRGTATLPWPSA